MKRSAAFIPNGEDAAKVEMESLQMLLRGGFIRKNGEGIFTVLPLGKRIFSKLEKEIANQLEKLNAMEVMFPALQIKEDTNVNEQLFQIENSPYVLAANNLQTMLSLIQNENSSEYSLPLTFFQIDKAFCNDTVTSEGVQTNELLLNEVYSFHNNEESLQETYEVILNMYKNLLSKLGLNYRIVKGMTSTKIENAVAEEIIVLSDIGEETIAYSDQSGYSANIKIAEVGTVEKQDAADMKELKKTLSDNFDSLQDIVESENFIKAELYLIDEKYYMVLTRGDHAVNETKLKQILQAETIRLTDEKQIQKLLNCQKQFAGPVKLPLDVKVIADNSVKNMYNAICGANENGVFYENVNPNRDFAINQFVDIRLAQEGDLSPDKEGILHLQKGIKVGHTLKFEIHGKDNNPIYGSCYYFGISRLFIILAETFHDSNGFFWPKEIAPYQIYLVVKDIHDPMQRNLAEEIYNILTFYQFDVLFDDRDEKTETKFIDADLIGLPIRVTIGEKAQDGMIDVKIRSTNQTLQFAKEELIDWLSEYFRVE